MMTVVVVVIASGGEGMGDQEGVADGEWGSSVVSTGRGHVVSFK